MESLSSVVVYSVLKPGGSHPTQLKMPHKDLQLSGLTMVEPST